VADLLDVNVLVAVLVPTHEHHALAREWVVSRGAAEGWATCPLTELGVIRSAHRFQPAADHRVQPQTHYSSCE
jgi:predicted nucleic acid-binding protein